MLGDLICTGRSAAKTIRFEDLPAGGFASHCDIVVGHRTQASLSVIGGNVDDAVTMKHIPTDAAGRIAAPRGQRLRHALSLDGRAARPLRPIGEQR